VVIENLVLRNYIRAYSRQLLVAAKRYSAFFRYGVLQQIAFALTVFREHFFRLFLVVKIISVLTWYSFRESSFSF
jgi:hypothetical protein